MALETGLKGVAETTVTEANVAVAVGSGTLPVFATPMMVALMEHAAVNAVAGHLGEGEGTVGIHMDVSHDSATPIGMKVRAEVELTEVDGRALTFNVAAYDEAGLIGKGVHKRFIIKDEKFMARTQSKLSK